LIKVEKEGLREVEKAFGGVTKYVDRDENEEIQNHYVDQNLSSTGLYK
jgi:hypothetical protein